ncbi:hypothetical protein GCM10023085_79180 [Actinomadura viridis]|uniref:Uncharacterized protein n=1 Tax=Actinomadura viridis TaxID=58110 RepID=A0A931DRH9_9ACTN|nr:hypothetical protein [Actinomadura viridis]MBG6093433.1 hypothetical protein [Actinomadura viridis]
MEHELVGLRGPGGRWRPVAAGPFALVAVALALLPIRPVWLWAALIAVVAAVPWALGAAPEARRRRPRPYWRLSAEGLERVGRGGLSLTRYERSRIEGLAITTGDGVLTVLHRFGRTAVGTLDSMGMEPLPFFVTARRLGVPVHLLDGDAADLAEQAGEEAPEPSGPDGAAADLGLPRHHAAEQRLLDQEAALLAAAHEPPRRAPSPAPDLPAQSPPPGALPGSVAPAPAPAAAAASAPSSPSSDTRTAASSGAAPVTAAGAPGTGREPVRLATPAPLPSRRRIALLGGLSGLLGAVMVARIAMEGTGGFGARLAAGCWALAAITGMLAARRRMLRATRIQWTISGDGIEVRGRPGVREALRLPAGEIAALVVGPGLRPDPLTGEPRRADPAVLAFDHRLRLIARLPAHGLDAFQLTHALDDHGHRVVTPGRRPPRTPEYGLDGLPEIFAQVPGGRLVVTDGGLGWADAAGDVVLRMPEDRLGGIELLTIAGHAWVRLYDADGEEFFAAPLSALRIARTDLRESARRAGLPVNDAEYDAYLSAAFHSAVATLSAPQQGPAPAVPDPSGRAGRAAPGTGDGEESGERPSPVSAPGALLDATRRSRLGTYLVSVLLCEMVALLGAVWLGPDLGGFLVTASWSLPAGVVIGLGGYWLYDRDRAQLRVSSAGLAVVTRRGRVEWDLVRERVGGVGIDESADRMPRLVVWSPAGRVLRQVGFPPDLEELRRACERYGLPWGPPDADRPAPPPPEL